VRESVPPLVTESEVDMERAIRVVERVDDMVGDSKSSSEGDAVRLSVFVDDLVVE
jgi:hypothetical protein